MLYPNSAEVIRATLEARLKERGQILNYTDALSLREDIWITFSPDERMTYTVARFWRVREGQVHEVAPEEIFGDSSRPERGMLYPHDYLLIKTTLEAKLARQGELVDHGDALYFCWNWISEIWATFSPGGEPNRILARFWALRKGEGEVHEVAPEVLFDDYVYHESGWSWYSAGRYPRED